jgi:DNA-binding transcriptional regulator GbsR (MarR family)
MGELKLVQKEEKLMTVQEIAEAKGVSKRRIRQIIAEIDDFEPEELRINAQGKPTPLYSLDKWEIAISHLEGQKAIEKLPVELQKLLAAGTTLKAALDDATATEARQQLVSQLVAAKEHYGELSAEDARQVLEIVSEAYVQLEAQNKAQLEFFDTEYTAWNQCEMDYQDEVAKITERARIAEDEVQALRDPEYRKREQKRTKWWKDFINATR